jgi:hypothetical protein
MTICDGWAKRKIRGVGELKQNWLEDGQRARVKKEKERKKLVHLNA